jgi:hypothetical protein
MWRDGGWPGDALTYTARFWLLVVAEGRSPLGGIISHFMLNFGHNFMYMYNGTILSPWNSPLHNTPHTAAKT